MTFECSSPHRLTQHKRFVPYGTHPNFCFAKTSFMLVTLSEIAYKRIIRFPMFDIVPIIIAGIEKNISPHTLRNTYATQYYRQTKDIETLRRILGHSDISTTNYLYYPGQHRCRKWYEVI